MLLASTLSGAASGSGAAGVNQFFSTPFGVMLSGILGVFGLLVAIVAVFSAIKHFTSGAHSQGVKIILGGLFIAALLAFPSLIFTGIQASGHLLQAIFSSGKTMTTSG